MFIVFTKFVFSFIHSLGILYNSVCDFCPVPDTAVKNEDTELKTFYHSQESVNYQNTNADVNNS